MRLISITLALMLLLSLGIPAGAAEVLPETPPAPVESPAPTEPEVPAEPPAPTVTETPAPAEEPENESFTIDLSIVGDCMLATYMGGYSRGSFNWYAANKDPSYFLEKVKPVFEADDFTIANLEAVLTDRKLTETPKKGSRVFWFKGPASNAKILTSGSVEAVSLANNHTGDYGEAGRKDTIAAVEAEGLKYGNHDNTFVLEKNGFRIAVICHGLWSEGQASQIIPRIQKWSELSDYQIVFYHGGKESTHKPEDWRVRASRKLVDAGADLVIGNHPHVLQPREVYKGADIVYSLGNFCYGGHSKPENRTIIYKMMLTVDQGEVTKQESSMIPCYVYTGGTNNWQPAPLTDPAARQKVLDFMAWKRNLPY